MCYPVDCQTCHKTTWAGCGEHIDSVKAMVPADQWCDGSHTPEEVAAAQSAAAQATAVKPAGSSVFARLFKR